MHKILLQSLILNFSWNKSRLECFSQIITSLIAYCSVFQKDMALGIKGKAKADSKVKRIYRLFKEQIFDYDQIAKYILGIFKQDSYVIALDRTCWKFGKTDINILFLVIVVGKISVPLYWQVLTHGGACTGLMMQSILKKFINNFGIDKIKYLLADREFMSIEWLNYLTTNEINYAIPLRKDMRVRINNSLVRLPIGKSFNHLKADEYSEVTGILWSYPVKLAAYRNDRNELMVIASFSKIDVNIFALYKYRWAIERLFKHLKTSGFDIAKSHITKTDRFAKLVAVCSIASALVVKNGLVRQAIEPIKIKMCKGIPKQLVSIFTYGLDQLKICLTQSLNKITSCINKILQYDKNLVLFKLNA